MNKQKRDGIGEKMKAPNKYSKLKRRNSKERPKISFQGKIPVKIHSLLLKITPHKNKYLNKIYHKNLKIFLFFLNQLKFHRKIKPTKKIKSKITVTVKYKKKKKINKTSLKL